MAEPAWQETLRLRLVERNANESAYASIIEQCTSHLSALAIAQSHPSAADRRLAQQTKLLKERNASLLRAVSSVKQNPSSSTVFIPGTSDEYATLLMRAYSRLSLTTFAQEPCTASVYRIPGVSDILSS